MDIKEVLSAVHKGELMGLNQAKELIKDCITMHEGKNVIDHTKFLNAIEAREKLLITRIQTS